MFFFCFQFIRVLTKEYVTSLKKTLNVFLIKYKQLSSEFEIKENEHNP